jgi:Domain of unknown function (DUF5666)
MKSLKPLWALRLLGAAANGLAARLAARLIAGLMAGLMSVGLLLVAACGGVGQDGTGAVPDTQTTGVVNGFGSVIVNGIHFDVTGAQITVDGAAGAAQADLRVGMVVTVTGRVAADASTGTASRLVYESLLRGSIDETPGALSLRVLGQRIHVDQTTVFSGAAGASELRLGDRLQVSGFRDADGSLRATWVQRESGSGTPQLTGFVSAVAGNTITVSGLVIDISRAVLQGFGAAVPATGQLVRVALEAAPVAGTAAASRVSLIDISTPAEVRKQQLQGIVTLWDAAAGRFVLNGLGGQPVRVDANTQFTDGTVADLANGKRVEVRGTRGSDGVLTAERLEFYRSVLSAYGRGKVTAVDVAGKRFNVLDVPGVEVRLRDGTLLDDSSVLGGVLSLSNLLVGDEVLVLGRANGDRIDADLVQRLPRIMPGAGVGGAVSRIAGATLTILGTAVNVNGAEFFDLQGNAQTQAAFLAALQQGEVVRAEGLYAAGVLTARTVRRVP